MIMDKSQIQERTKKLLEKTDKPKEFTRGLQELLKSYVDREATKNYQTIIPSQILENFMEFHFPF